MIKITKQDHDRICDLVEKEMNNRGFKTIQSLVYKDIRNGEIDVLAFKEGYSRAITFEIKYTNNYPNKRHAKEQLYRSEKYCNFLKQFDNITKFYVYHHNGKNHYKIERVI